MPSIPSFTDEWDGGEVLESSGLVSINGISLENSPDWHSFSVNFGYAIRGTVAEASRTAFLAAIDAGDGGLPLTVYGCHCPDPHLVSSEVEFDADWNYVIRGDALQPWGHSVAWKLKACRHVIVTEEITWTFDGDTALGTFPTDPALNWWGFLPYPAGLALESTNDLLSTGSGANLPLTVGTEPNAAIYLFVLNQDQSGSNRFSAGWQPEGSVPGSVQSFTKLTEVSTAVAGDLTEYLSVWRLLAPQQTITSSVVRTSDPADHIHAVGGFVLSGVDQTTPEITTATNSGTGTSTSLTISSSGGLALDAAGWLEANASSIATPTPGGGQTQAWARSFDNSFGRADAGHGGSSGSDTPSWSLGASRKWVAAGVRVRGA